MWGVGSVRLSQHRRRGGPLPANSFQNSLSAQAGECARSMDPDDLAVDKARSLRPHEGEKETEQADDEAGDPAENKDGALQLKNV